jgi:predicted acyltransferase
MVKERILAVDVMRGLTLFLMLFVNDLYERGVPKWLVHTEGSVDGMGLADWVFPGFLFMVGISIPYAIAARKRKGQSIALIFGHIIIRTISLLAIGVMILNIDRLNEELSGINQQLWAILLYVSIFLIWNNYPKDSKYKMLFMALRVIGAIGFISLATSFKAGENGNVSWLETGWWGILGLIGWGYFVAALICLFFGNRLWTTVAFWLLFVALNMLSQKGMLWQLDFLNPVFGVIIDGNVPSIVLAGLVLSSLLSQINLSPQKTVITILVLGLAVVGVGFFLRNWFIISKIYGTPSWAMLCNGISLVVFAGLYWLLDIKKQTRFTKPFQFVGQNSLTTYLAPDIIYFTCWGLGISIFVYKQDASQLLAVSGSLIWAALMVGFSILLSKINIKLKL